MMGVETIRAMAREAAERAAEENMVPFIYWSDEEVTTYDGFPFPFLGDYVPDGWEKVDEHFVDSSGLGYDDEPALSTRQFTALVLERMAATPRGMVGWAVTEAGQFQVYVGEYRKT